MRNAFRNQLLYLMKKHKKIHLLTADLGFEVFEPIQERLPDQFTNVGVAEANMITLASGMARVGLHPICYSIITFLTYRAFEQIRNDICYPKLNVKLVGVGVGFGYSYNGQSHCPIEDISVMRSLPNLTILSPADAAETQAAVNLMMEMKGPVYLRLGKKGEPSLPLIKNQDLLSPRVLYKGEKLIIFSTSVYTHVLVEAVQALQKQGITPTVVHLPVLKPLKTSSLKILIMHHAHVMTVEEHSVIGGLGSILAEINCQLEQPRPQTVLGIPDSYMTSGGSRQFMLKTYGLDAINLEKKIKKVFASLPDDH